MSYAVVQTRRFGRQYKKLHDNGAADVDQAVADVADNPLLGEQKKGDRAALRVHKFRSQNQLYLLGYTLDDQVRLVYLEAVGGARELLSRSQALRAYPSRRPACQLVVGRCSKSSCIQIHSGSCAPASCDLDCAASSTGIGFKHYPMPHRSPQ